MQIMDVFQAKLELRLFVSLWHRRLMQTKGRARALYSILFWSRSSLFASSLRNTKKSNNVKLLSNNEDRHVTFCRVFLMSKSFEAPVWFRTRSESTSTVHCFTREKCWQLEMKNPEIVNDLNDFRLDFSKIRLLQTSPRSANVLCSLWAFSQRNEADAAHCTMW